MKNKLLQTSLMEKSSKTLFFRSEAHALIKIVIVVLLIVFFILSMNKPISTAVEFKISVITFAAIAFLLMGIKHNAVIDISTNTVKTEKMFFFVKRIKEFNIDKNTKTEIKASGKTQFLNININKIAVYIASSRNIESLEKWNDTITDMIQNIKK